MPFTIDTIFDVVAPLTGPRLSPAVLPLLAYAVAPGPMGDALWQLRHGRSVFAFKKTISRREGLRDLMRTIYDTLKSRTWLRAFAIISLVRIINRLGTHLVVDRAFPRRIVWPNHTVVITGGARGIAGRICELLKDKGATVVVLDRAPRSEHGREDLYLSVDVTDEKDMLAARDAVRKEIGYPTCVPMTGAMWSLHLDKAC